MNIAGNESIDRDSDSRATHASGSGRAAVPTQRLDQIRERLREGAYDGAAVREATARGIVARGDV